MNKKKVQHEISTHNMLLVQRVNQEVAGLQDQRKHQRKHKEAKGLEGGWAAAWGHFC